MENDTLEELFRKQADESLSQEKPRDVVWQKIESNLNQKTAIPKKHFIQSVWFSAAVFALIAVPYFYFFIENMGHNEQNSNFVKTSIPEIFEENEPNKPQILDSILSEDAVEIVKLEKQQIPVSAPLKAPQQNKIPQSVESDHEIAKIKPYKFDSIVPVLASATIDAPKDSDVTVSKIMAKDTMLLASNANVAVSASGKVALRSVVAEQKPSNAQPKKIEPIQISRNRFVLQDKVNRVGFNFIRKANNKLIFESTALRLSVIRENGVVKIITNSNRINKDVLILLQNNKERIYNYYINFDKPAS